MKSSIYDFDKIQQVILALNQMQVAGIENMKRIVFAVSILQNPETITEEKENGNDHKEIKST